MSLDAYQTKDNQAHMLKACVSLLFAGSNHGICSFWLFCNKFVTFMPVFTAVVGVVLCVQCMLNLRDLYCNFHIVVNVDN
jgi:hypothetical protein